MAASCAWLLDEVTPEEWVELTQITGKSIEEMQTEPWHTHKAWMEMSPERLQQAEEWSEHCMCEFA